MTAAQVPEPTAEQQFAAQVAAVCAQDDSGDWCFVHDFRWTVCHWTRTARAIAAAIAARDAEYVNVCRERGFSAQGLWVVDTDDIRQVAHW